MKGMGSNLAVDDWHPRKPMKGKPPSPERALQPRSTPGAATVCLTSRGHTAIRILTPCFWSALQSHPRPCAVMLTVHAMLFSFVVHSISRAAALVSLSRHFALRPLRGRCWGLVGLGYFDVRNLAREMPPLSQSTAGSEWLPCF